MSIIERPTAAPSEALSITSGLVEDLSASATTPFGCYFAGPGDPLAAEARELERSVFFETFGNTQEMLDAEYGPYDDASVFGVIVDHNRSRVAGMIRLILDKHGSLKSMADIGNEPWGLDVEHVIARSDMADFDPQSTFDVATLAVDPEYRQGRASSTVSFSLYQSVLTLTRRAGINWLVTILDVVVLDLIQSSVNDIFSFYDGVEPKRYLDSPSSVPVFADLARFIARIDAIDPALTAVLFDGDGFPEAISPPNYDRAAEIVRSIVPASTSVQAEVGGTPRA